jgi:hypothetical protein
MSTIGSSALAQNTLAPLGVYLDGQPNGNDTAAEAYFEKEYAAFVNIMGGARPGFYNAYTDFSQDPSQWGASASWGAWSAARTGNSFIGPGSGTVPVVGVPMADPTFQYGSIDGFYKQVISGQLDASYTAIVDAWASEGYKTAEFRIGYEFNGSMAWTPPANGSNNADFVAAWQHIANLVHAEGAKDGIAAKTVWDPATSNGSSYDVQTLYPGDQYVDVISTDVYGGGVPNNLVDFATGGTTVDATYAAWAAQPANLAHYYLYSNFTLGNFTPGLGATTASGYGWSVADTIAFAKLHNKPLGIDEAGATSGQDDGVFPAWLATTIAGAEAQGVTIDHTDIWSNGTSTWDFVNGERPLEAAAWAAGFGAGSGKVSSARPTISLSAPGAVWEASPGAGVTVALSISTTNLTGPVYEEVLTASGSVESAYTPVTLANGAATASVFLAHSGDTVQVVDNPITPTIAVTSSPVTIIDPVVNPSAISLSSPGTVQEPSVGAGVSVPLTITTTALPGDIYYEVLNASGAIETPYTAALPAGAAITLPTTIPQQTTHQTFSVQVAFNYVPIRANLEYASSTSGVVLAPFTSNTGITWDATGQVATIPIIHGQAMPHYFEVVDTSTSVPLQSGEIIYQVGASGSSGGGTITVAPPVPVGASQTFTILPHLAATGDVVRVVDNPTSPKVTTTSAPVTITDPVVTPPSTVTIGSGSDTLALKVSEDAYQGNAQFVVSVDGKQVGGTQTATASHAAGQSQTFDVMGTFAAGKHTATVNFLNDAYGGSPSLDRNLYVTGATIDNSVVSPATLSEVVAGPQSFGFMAPGSGGSAPPLPASDVVTVNQPATLQAAVQTITGMETDPSQALSLAWFAHSTPPLSSADWVKASVQSNGQFSASVDVDQAGTMSTMFYHAGSGPVTAAWSATPV